MPSVSFDKLEKADEGLSIIFLVLILVSNIFLFIMIARASGGLKSIFGSSRRLRNIILLSIMAGDVFAGLFSHTVRIHYLFSGHYKEDWLEEYDADPQKFLSRGLECRDINLSAIYMIFMLPLSHGIALIILSIESAAFRLSLLAKGSPTKSRALVCLLLSALPWVLGMAIVLPLTLVDFDEKNCENVYNTTRYRVMLWICQVLPVVASGTVAIASLILMNLYSKYYAPPRQTTPGQTVQASSVCSPPTDNGQPSSTPSPQGQGTEHGEERGPRSQQNPNTTITLNPPSSTHLTIGQSSQTTTAAPTTHPTPGAARYNALNQTVSTLPQRSAPNYFMKNEAIALLLANSVFFVCVLTYPIVFLDYILGEDTGELTRFSRVFATEFAFWMLNSRAFISPIMWLLSGNFRKSDTTTVGSQTAHIPCG